MSLPAEPGGRSLMLGIMRLALLRADGIGQFGDTRQCFLNSLAPLVAFPLVAALIGLVSGVGAAALTALLVVLVAILAPPVISHVLARVWGREPEWLRYATAFNWLRLAMMAAFVLSLPAMAVMVAAGLGEEGAMTTGLLGVALYNLLLDWFLARVGLRLDGWRAALLVMTVQAGVAALLFAPALVGMPQGPQPG
jgi:hypothetical protein